MVLSNEAIISLCGGVIVGAPSCVVSVVALHRAWRNWGSEGPSEFAHGLQQCPLYTFHIPACINTDGLQADIENRGPPDTLRAEGSTTSHELDEIDPNAHTSNFSSPPAMLTPPQEVTQAQHPDTYSQTSMDNN
ncbi:hypothetical protein PG995_005644 [Apiospora arundinis]